MSIACKVRPIGGEALLPDGYRRCEYLESTGTQYIDTGWLPDISAKILVEYEPVKIDYTSAVLGNHAGNNIRLIPRISSLDNQQETAFQFFSSEIRGPLELNKRYIAEIYEKTAILNGEIFSLDSRITASTISLKLFGQSASFLGFCKIYQFSISRNNQLQLNFIPCLDDKGKPCMFDTVRRTPYYNKGTGEFIYKLKTPLIRKLPRGYQSLEYLESTGTQWIDTGIKLSNDSDFKITCEFFSKSEPDGNSHYAFGIGPSSIACYPLLPTRYLPHFYLNGAYITFGDAVQRCVVEYTNNYVILNDIKQIFSNAGEAVTASESIAVFSSRLGVSPLIGHIHSFGISRNGILQLDLIPCLDDKGNPCMWDYVTRRPFYNQNTTGPDFLYG